MDRIPRIRSLGTGSPDWHDVEPAAGPSVSASVSTGWVRSDGETDIRTFTYSLDGTLSPSEALELADVQLRHPGFIIRQESAHSYLGVVVLRAWSELFDDAPMPDTYAEMKVYSGEVVTFSVRCAPQALNLFQRVGHKLLQPITDHTMAAVIRLFSEEA